MKFQFEIKNRQVFLAVLLISIITLLTLAIAITASNPGHTSNDIMISINGAEKTLQSAIDAREISASIFTDDVDGIVLKSPCGLAKISIGGTSYVVTICNITESIARVYTSGKTLNGHTIAPNAYLCTIDDYRDYTATTFCQAFGYSKGSTGVVRCGSNPTQAKEYSRNGAWGSTFGACSGGGLCSNEYYIVSIECLK